MRLREDASIWGVCVRIGVSFDNFFRSNNSIANLIEVREVVFCLNEDTSLLKFGLYICTPLLLFAMLLTVIFVDNKRGAVLLWAFNVLSHFVRMVPRDLRLTFADICIPIERWRAPSDIVSDLLQRLDISRMWTTVPRADQGARLPNIESETDGPVPYEYLLYAFML